MGTDNFDTIKIDLWVFVLTIMVVCLTSEKYLVFWKKVFILHHGSIFNHLISDYVTKPFSPLILMKRIENIFRSTVTESEIVVGDLRVSIDDCTVYWQEEKMSPTKKEYEIIQALAKRKNHLVTRDQLMNTIWGYSELDSRVLDNHVKNIRKKIPGIPLKTITGMGYQFGGEEE